MAKNISITRIYLRYLVPLVIILPLITAAVVWVIVKKDLFYSNTIAFITFAGSTILLLVITTLIVSAIIHKAELKLQNSEKIARLLVEHRRDYAIYMLDDQGIITSWNKGAERLTGYKSNEMIGKNFSFLFTPEDQQQNKPEEILEKVRIEKQTEYECWRLNKNGHRFWVVVTITALINGQHQIIGFTELVRNANRQKEADDKLKQSLFNLEQSNKELERFAYIASHDLQEPLRMVASFTQLLEKKFKNQLPTEAQEYINFAVDGALRMQQLITDLLAYSKVSTTAKLFSPTNCNTIVEEAILNLSVAIQESNAVITCDKLPTIMADDTQMLQIFQNLLSNAIKFRNRIEAPTIHISADLKDNTWHFGIQDNGIGIAPEYQEQIFLIFQRLHTKQEYSGTGIGLAICKKIIERHGGKIWIESKLGEGAKFCFTIPT